MLFVVMNISVHCCADICVSHLSLDCFDINSRCIQHRTECVSQTMRSEYINGFLCSESVIFALALFVGAVFDI